MVSRKAISRIIFVITFLTAFGRPPSDIHALTVENVTFADSVQIGTATLPLYNTAVLRYLKIFDVYVAALYLPQGTKPDRALADVPKCLVLHYLVSIKSSDLSKGAEPVLKSNQTPAELAALRSRFDRVNAIYRDVAPGDRYALTYLPGKGTELALNGMPLVVVEGADFAAAYFGIWLGRESIDDTLERDLLKER